MAHLMNDELLRQYVDGIFSRYDVDHSNTLTLKELTVFFNDLIASRGSTHAMTPQQVQHSLNTMDTNNDGKITKKELFDALKRISVQSAIHAHTPGNQGMLYPSLESAITPDYYDQPKQEEDYFDRSHSPQYLNPGVNPKIQKPKQQYEYNTPYGTRHLPESYQAQPYVAKKAPSKPMKTLFLQNGRFGPKMMTQPQMMQMGPMSMRGMGPMGPMGPMGGMDMGMGPMGPFGMNPLSAMIGGMLGGMYY